MKLCLDEIKVSYRTNANGNVINNFRIIELGDVTIYYSYKTVIGFYTPKHGLVASENVWGTTTGKHLNLFSNYEERIPREKFLEMLNNIILDIKIWE